MPMKNHLGVMACRKLVSPIFFVTELIYFKLLISIKGENEIRGNGILVKRPFWTMILDFVRLSGQRLFRYFEFSGCWNFGKFILDNGIRRIVVLPTFSHMNILYCFIISAYWISNICYSNCIVCFMNYSTIMFFVLCFDLTLVFCTFEK